MKKYMGIADAYGIESFLEVTEDSKKHAFGLIMRANANKQRHAVFYVTNLSEEHIQEIEVLLAKKNYVNSLKVLKRRSKNVVFPRSIGSAEKSWKLIPNHKLDSM